MVLNRTKITITSQKRRTIHFVCLFLCPFISFVVVNYSVAGCHTFENRDPDKTEIVYLQYIYDGDTLKLKDGRKIRLIGINTPEIGRKGKKSQAYAQKAKKELRHLLSSSTSLYLVYDEDKKDKYQRILAYLYLQDGTDVQGFLLSAGLAMSIVVLPNDRNLNCYRELEAKAKNKKIGIWQQKKYDGIQAKRLTRNVKGYRFVNGKVTAVKNENAYMLLELDKMLSIKLSKVAYSHYKKTQFKGREISVRGWVYPFKHKLGLTLYHPDNMSLK